jgi:ATP-dependent DNA helicase HFM1/MER3
MVIALETRLTKAFFRLGRAGRPGFDDHGVGVVMTKKSERSYYDNLDQEVVESTLPALLIEGTSTRERNLHSYLHCGIKALTAEITQGVITDISEAIDWIKSTFFFVRSCAWAIMIAIRPHYFLLRVKKNPVHYKFPSNLTIEQLTTRLREHCVKYDMLICCCFT